MKSFDEFRSDLNESYNQREYVNAVVKALEGDDIKFSNLRGADRKSLVITVKKDYVIYITHDGHIAFNIKGKPQDLVFKKPVEIANKIVDLLNLEGIGDSAFGAF